MLLLIAIVVFFAAIDPAIVAIVAAIAGPLAAYLAAAKRFSGKIESSAATDLWAESRAIREWSQARIKELNDHIEQLEERVRCLEEQNEQLIADNHRLQAERDRYAEVTRRLRPDEVD